MTEARPFDWLRRTFRLWQFLGFAFAAVIVLGANPFKAHTITPFDVLVTHQAWSWLAPPDVQARNPERSDVLDGLLPQWITAKKQIRSGEWPLWNPYPAGGSPELPFTTALFTPAFAVFAAIPSTALAFYVAIVFNLAIAGLGMYWFLRRRLGWVAAAMGALTFEFCGFHAAWLYWPHVFTSIWLPWLLLAVDRCAEKPAWSRGTAIAVTTALVVLGGFPFVASLVLEAGFLYAAILAATRWRNRQRIGRHAFAYASGTALGFLLCAIPLYAFAHWFLRFDLDYRQGGGFPLAMAKYLFAPWSYGFQHVEFTMYVGMLAIGLGAVGIASIIVRRTRVAPLWAFGLLLFVAAFGLVFNLWPLWLIGWIPGMGSNPWSRAICILDASVIILAAVGLDYLASRRWATPQPVKLLLVAVAIVQVADMAHFFHYYNGATRSAYAYPETPSISYMQKHSGPFDYVIADDSFLSSGTLGAYGLREWFAHAFANRPLQHAMIRMAFQPFTSRTASILPADQIKFDSRAMAVFNVKFIATRSSFDPYAIYPPHAPTSKRTALPPLPANAWTQTIEINQPSLRLAGVSVRLATYQRVGLSGTVTLVLRDTAQRIVASATIGAHGVEDNLMQAFRFAHPVDLTQGTYAMNVEYRPGPHAEGDQLTAWAFDAPERPTILAVNGHPEHLMVDYALHPAANDEHPFHAVLTADGTTVFENTASPGGPYFLASIGDQPAAASGRTVSIVTYRPDAFSLRYHGTSAGFVVIPMGFTRGWKVAANGKPVRYDLKDGLMPAVPVTGPTTITFTYEPQASRWLALWALIVLLSLGATYLGDRYLGRKQR